MVVSPKPIVANDALALAEAQRQAAKVIDSVADSIKAQVESPENPLNVAMARLNDTVKEARDTIRQAIDEANALVGDLLRSLEVSAAALGEAFAPPAPKEEPKGEMFTWRVTLAAEQVAAEPKAEEQPAPLSGVVVSDDPEADLDAAHTIAHPLTPAEEPAEADAAEKVARIEAAWPERRPLAGADEAEFPVAVEVAANPPKDAGEPARSPRRRRRK